MPESAPVDPSQPSKTKPSNLLRSLLTVLLVALVFVGVVFLGRRKRSQRLDAFAKCLTSKRAQMYGAYWCPHCADQKELFGSSFQYINYVECGVPGSRQESDSCKAAGIKLFPTWQFSSGERLEGAAPITTLSEKTACGLP